MRPIDADALHKEISEWPESVMYKDWVQSAIANAPTIDLSKKTSGARMDLTNVHTKKNKEKYVENILR